MKCVIAGLVELAGPNQMLLGQAILHTMHANGFKVDNVSIEFMPDNGEPLPQVPEAFRPDPGRN